MFKVRFFVFIFVASCLFLAISCSKKSKQSSVPAQDQSKQTAQTEPQSAQPPATEPAPQPSVSEPPPPRAPSADYTDIKDVEMDETQAIGKTCRMNIMMDYSGIREGTFRAYACRNGDAYTGVNFRMSFDASTRSIVRNMNSMECTSGKALFKITGKGRLENFTAKLIGLE
jgi:hypothetical protein